MSKKVSSKKSSKQQVEKIILVTSIFQKKITKQKTWVREIKTKDGGLTKYGVNTKGHRFTERTKREKTEEDIRKSFNKTKSEKSTKNNITIKMFTYTGIFRKKSKRVSGGKINGVFHYNIGKRASIKRGVKIFTFTTSADSLIKQLKLIESYKEDEQ